MKRALLLLVAIFMAVSLFSQTTNELLKEGIRLHDAGKYEEALAKYEEVLKIDPESTDAWYEMSYSYMLLGDYKNAHKYSSKVIKAGKNNLVEAYMVAGSSLDNMGKVDKSIALFKEAIELHGDHYLFHFNLGLTYFKDDQLENARDALINAVQANPEHTSSHMLLGYVMHDMGRKPQSILCLYHFLLLEPNSSRSQTAYTVLMKQLGAGDNVSKSTNDKGKTEIHLNMGTGDLDDKFYTVDILISMMAALNLSEENEEKTPFALFISNTTDLFNMVGEIKENEGEKKKKKQQDLSGLWWDYYVPLFYSLGQSEHMPAFCAYISGQFDEEANQWLKTHDTEVEALAAFLKKDE